jgi:S1-C subfamily serine protease
MAAVDAPSGLLAALSDEIAGAVDRAGRAVATVHGRRGLAASGLVWPGGDSVVTAAHVLERPRDIRVTLAGGQQVPAALAGWDPESDVAVLRLVGAAPVAAELAPGGSVKPGHFVLALGRPGDGSLMVSFGVASAVGGPWRTGRGGLVDGYVRADLVLPPGFSGGPLIDVQGRVVGLNSSRLAAGESMAVPSHELERVVQALRTRGIVRRGYLGVSSQLIELQAALRQRLGLRQPAGLMLLGIEPGGPAEQGGLLMGDILLGLEGKPVADGEGLLMALGPEVVGKPVAVTIVRGGEVKQLTLTPGERPA